MDEDELLDLIDERVEERLEDEREGMTRRGALAAIGSIAGAGALGFYGGKEVAAAPADASGILYVEQLGDSTHPVEELYVNNQTTLNNTEQFAEVDVTDLLDVPSYADDPSALNGGLYWNSGRGVVAHKDSAGQVYGTVQSVEIDDTDSPYTTNGEDVVHVDNSSNTVEVVLSTEDLANKERPVAIIAQGNGLNDIIVSTEGTSQIHTGYNLTDTLNLGHVRMITHFWPADGRGNWATSLTTRVSELWGPDAFDEPIALYDSIIPNSDDFEDLGSASNRFYRVSSREIASAFYRDEVNALGNVSGSTDIALPDGNIVTCTLAGNTDFNFDTITRIGSPPPGKSFVLIVQQDGTGGHSITWPTNVEWGGGGTPSPSTAANAKHEFTFVSPDDGSTWVGHVGPQDIA